MSSTFTDSPGRLVLSLAGGVRGAASNTKDHRNDDDNEELYFPICDTNKDILLPATKENANVRFHSHFDRFRGDFGVKIFFSEESICPQNRSR